MKVDNLTIDEKMDKLVELQNSLYRQLRFARNNGEIENIETIKAEIAKVENEIANLCDFEIEIDE